jgi:hypothetical protein
MDHPEDLPPSAVRGPLRGAITRAVSRAGVLLGGREQAGSPSPLPAAVPVVVGVAGLGLQEVQETHGNLHVCALVAVERVGPPVVVEAIHQVTHAAVILA